MSVKIWFPTQIYYDKLDSNSTSPSLNDDLLEECYKLRDYDDEGRAWSEENYVGGYTSYSSMSELQQMSSTFMELQKHIDQHVNAFADQLEFELGEGTLEMQECWVNIMPAQTSHSSHIHPLSVVSGTYYVATPENSAGIKFEDPRIERLMASPPRKTECSDKNRQTTSYEAKAGHLVLFESWLRHEVPASVTSEDRVSISFNYSWV